MKYYPMHRMATGAIDHAGTIFTITNLIQKRKFVYLLRLVIFKKAFDLVNRDLRTTVHIST